jgi:uncharacterized protein (DUF849 family)
MMSVRKQIHQLQFLIRIFSSEESVASVARHHHLRPGRPRAPRSGDYVDEIIADTLAGFDAGAANVHHHIADFNLSGREAAEVYLSLWRRVRRIHV